MVTYEIVGKVNYFKITTILLPVRKTFCKIYTEAWIKKIFHHTVPMIFLYIVLQAENKNMNMGGACEHLKTVF